MAIKYYPKAGQVLTCNFHGFKEPEMVKVRPVIVVSPKLPYRAEIITVVPISLTLPQQDLPHVVRLSKNYHPHETDDLPCWAKCDMIANIARSRLEGFKVGRRKYHSPTVTEIDLHAIKIGILHGLGLNYLISNQK